MEPARNHDRKLLIQTFLTGVVLFLPIFLISFIRCDTPFCGFWAVPVLFGIYILLYPASIAYMLFVFRKPRLYRSLFTVLLANTTLFAVWQVQLGFEVISASNLMWFVFLFFVILYPGSHLLYYWLFNSLLPKLHR